MTKADAKVHLLDWILPLGFGAVLFLAVPLRTALELSTDEGYELMKAMLVSRGHPLYASVWSDHPPVFTQLLALLFRTFEPSAYVGRLLILCFAVALVWTLSKLVSRSFGWVGGLTATVLIASSSTFLEQSVAPMIELPAITLALASVLAASAYCSTRRLAWLVLSGALFGCALQVKLTSATLLPALTVAYLSSRPVWPDHLRDLAVWCGAVISISGLIVAVFYQPHTVSEFWASHFSTVTSAALPVRYAFRPGVFFSDARALSVATMLGVALLASKRRRDVLCPAVLFGTVLAIHWRHRPYWYYYDLHFAVPMAWLGAAGIVGWYGLLRNDRAKSWIRRSPARLASAWLAYSLVIVLTVVDAPRLIWNQVRRLHNAPLATQTPLVAALRRRAPTTKWAFADRPIYPFWAGLPVPPEMAGVPFKRIWSGSVTEETVYESWEKYKPDEILLLNTLAGWESRAVLSAYLRDHYELDIDASNAKLFRRRR